MSRSAVLNDAQWARIESLMPSSDGQRGRPFRDHRQVIEGIIFRLRTGVAWRDLPGSFGPWQTIWKRHDRFSTDGTWDKIHARLGGGRARTRPTAVLGDKAYSSRGNRELLRRKRVKAVIPQPDDQIAHRK